MNVSIWSPVTGRRSLEGPWLTLSCAWFYFREGGGGEGVVLPPGTGRELSEARGFSFAGGVVQVLMLRPHTRQHRV